MTDNEIIKALECCGNIVDSTCKKCVYHKTYNASCVVRLMRDALDLINRQKSEIEKKDIEIDILIRKKEALKDEVSELRAEIERLQEAGKEAVSCFTRMESLYKIKCKELEVAKSEAIKEFENKAIDKAYVNNYCEMVVSVASLEAIVKEMVGDDNA